MCRSCSRMAARSSRNPPAAALFIMLSVAALLLQHSPVPVNGFMPPRPSASAVVSSATNSMQLFAKASGGGGYNDNDDISDDSALYEDLRNRIQELGLDGESRPSSASSDELARKGAEADEEKEYVYIGGERFYLPPPPPSSSSSSRPASMLDQGEQPSNYLTSPNGYDASNAVSSRRELLEEAKPSIIGSLEGLALAISLFFVVTVAATGGSLFASNTNGSIGSSTASQHVILDPDALLKEDFARDGSSVFYGQTFEE